MTRYQALRKCVGLDPVSSAFVAFGNWIFGVPCGIIRICTVEIEYGKDAMKTAQEYMRDTLKSAKEKAENYTEDTIKFIWEIIETCLVAGKKEYILSFKDRFGEPTAIIEHFEEVGITFTRLAGSGYDDDYTRYNMDISVLYEEKQ